MSNVVSSIVLGKNNGQMCVTVIYVNDTESVMTEIYSSNVEYCQRLGSLLESMLFYKAPEDGLIVFKHNDVECKVKVSDLRMGGMVPMMVVDAINSGSLVVDADSVYYY